MNYKKLFKVLVLQILFLISVIDDSKAQNEAIIDSLKNIINTSANVKSKIDAINAYAYEFRHTNADTGFIIVTQAYALSKKINYHTGIGDYYDYIGTLFFNDNFDSSYYFFNKAIAAYVEDRNIERITQGQANLSNLFMSAGQYDSALYYARIALAGVTADNKINAKGREKKIMWLYQCLGNIFYYLSYYDSSTFYAQSGLTIAEETKDINAQASFWINISNVYAQQEDFKKSILYLKKAAELDMACKNYKSYTLCLTNIASHLFESGKYNEARQYADSAIKTGKANKITKHLSHNYQTFGDIEMGLHHYNKAIEYYLTGLSYCNKYPNLFIESALQGNIGEIYLLQNNPAKAKGYFLEVLQKSKDDRETIQLCYKDLSETYEKLNDYKEANRYLKLSSDLKDSVFNERTEKTISDLNIKYETNKKEQQIALLNKDARLNAVNAQKNSQQKNFAIMAFFSLCIGGGYSFYKYRKQKLLEREQSVLEERLRISRDLHDDLGSALSSISVYGIAIKQRLEHNQVNEALHLLDVITEDAQEMVTNMSDMVWMINSGNNTLEKIADRIRLFIDNIYAAKNILFLFSIDEQLKSMILNVSARKNIFLILKEAINNAVKHAHCDKIAIKILQKDDELLIWIADNGKGYNVDEKQEGNGLSNIEHRAVELDGIFEITSASGRGTTLTFSFSIPKIGDYIKN